MVPSASGVDLEQPEIPTSAVHPAGSIDQDSDDEDPEGLLEAAGAQNNSHSIALHWSLLMSGPEEEAYSSTVTTRRTVGFTIVTVIFVLYVARRVAFLLLDVGSVTWKGPVANVAYGLFTAIVVCSNLTILYYYRTDRAACHRKVYFATSAISVFMYAFIFSFIVTSAGQQHGCEEEREWISIAKAYVVAPLFSAMFGFNYMINWFCFICLTAAYNHATQQFSTSASAVVTDGVLQGAIVLIVLYALERRDRHSFLLNVHTVQLMRNERKATREARRMARSFSRMVSAISHDLKTPMSAIQTGTRLLNKFCKQEPIATRETELVLFEMKNATEICVSFLESLCSSATLLDAGNRELEPICTPVCIPDIIDLALGTCGLWSTNDVVLTRTGNNFPLLCCCSYLEFEQGLQGVYSSETMLIRNLLNLVTNAIKHTLGGRIHVNAQLKIFNNDADVFVEFQVSDTGNGVSKQYCGDNSDRIWLPFESGVKSTGLGLFVVKRQSEALGGKCGWYNNEPKGSVFWFTVPFMPIQIETAKGQQNPVAVVPYGPAGCTRRTISELSEKRQSERNTQERAEGRVPAVKHGVVTDDSVPTNILLIDDSLPYLELLAMEFKLQGIQEVDLAGGALTGLEMLQRAHYTIVFCDFNMPGQNGAQLVSQFREWERVHRPNMPVAQIWGLTGEQQSEPITALCRDAGMNGVLMKPLETPIALQLIKQAQITNPLLMTSQL